MSVFTFDSVQVSNKRTKFNYNITVKANLLVHFFYNCVAHILLSSDYTLKRILIAQESFKIIFCTCSRDSPGFVSQKVLRLPISGQVGCLFFFGFSSSIFNISDNQCKNISGAKTSGSHLIANIIQLLFIVPAQGLQGQIWK